MTLVIVALYVLLSVCFVCPSSLYCDMVHVNVLEIFVIV